MWNSEVERSVGVSQLSEARSSDETFEMSHKMKIWTHLDPNVIGPHDSRYGPDQVMLCFIGEH